MKVKVTPNNGLYVRKGPGKKHDHVRVLTEGDEVEVLEAKKGWGQIGEDEYIMLQFTEEVEEAEEAEDEETTTEGDEVEGIEDILDEEEGEK